MNRIASIISNSGVITLILDGSNYTVASTHPNYDSIKEALRDKDADLLLTLVDIPKAVSDYMGNGECSITNGVVTYRGEAIHNTLTERILSQMREGFPFEPMLRFLENLMQNPSKRAVDELYYFLAHKNLPITEDGHFLAYKGTRSNEYDRHSGTILNNIGAIIEMPRNKVDDNKENTCSQGLHVGTMGYVKGYCTDRVIICKVNPRDCVSVPVDHNAQKLRVCRYEVVSLYAGDLTNGVYSKEGSDYVPPSRQLEFSWLDFDDEDPPEAFTIDGLLFTQDNWLSFNEWGSCDLGWDSGTSDTSSYLYENAYGGFKYVDMSGGVCDGQSFDSWQECLQEIGAEPVKENEGASRE